MPSPLLFIVILNTNRREDTLECLASLAESTYEFLTVIVLDNASTDGSAEAIRSRFPDVRLINLEENRGYAGNNNVGIEAAHKQGADWILVLNEDTILDPDCLTHLVRVGESDDRIGILGPMVYHHDEPVVIQSAGGHLDKRWRATHLGQNQVDRGQFPAPHSVDWISGCAILVRREVIDQVGGLDDRFFYYWEETEWCLRARKKGWQIWHVPHAHLWHKGVQRDYQPSPNVTYYSTRNRLLMLSKHRAPLLPWITAIQETARTLTSWSLKPQWRTMAEHRDAMWEGALDFFRRRWGMRSP
jgi:GT2 family glycosyltransferase